MDRHHNRLQCRTIGRWMLLVACWNLVIALQPAWVIAQAPTTPASTEKTITTETPTLAADAEARIQEWIIGLGSGEYATRRRAFMELWKEGPVALPAVRRALTSSDQQTISAAKVLANLLSLDISPSDNDELAELLQLSGTNWEATLLSLGQKGYWRLAAEVLRSNANLVQSIRDNYPPNRFCNLVQAAFEQGDAFQAWPVIAQGLTPERRHYLTELTRQNLSRQYKGAIPVEIENALNIVTDEAALGEDERALHHLYAGRDQVAWDLNPSPRTKQRILYHTGKWERLKDPAVTALTLGSEANTLVRRTRQAAFMRLASDDAKSAELMAALRKELEQADLSKPKNATEGSLPELLKALIICGEGELMHDLVTRGKTTVDIDYLTYRFQHDQVFQKFGLDADLENFDEWLAELPGKLNPNGPQVQGGSNRIESYLELTRFMVHTGYAKQAETVYTTLLDTLRRQSIREVIDKWTDLLNRSEDHQIRRFLLKYLDENDSKLKSEERRLILVRIFPDWQNTVDKLWQYAPPELSQVEGQTKRWLLLERLWRYDRTLVPDEPAVHLVETWLTTSLREASKGEDASDESVGELATVALRLGLRRQALAMVRTEATRNIFADVAEMLTVNNSFDSAGKWWESAISQAPDRHMWIRRYADVLLMQGEAETAAKYESSIWLRPLGGRQLQSDDVPYAMIAEKYFDAGEYDLAQQYAEAAVALGDLMEQSWWARRMAAMAIEREDYTTAARGSRIFLLSLLMSGSNLVRTPIDTLQFYQYYTGQELLCNAAHDIQAGRIEAALTAIAKFESLIPSGIEICEHCYPLLVKAGQQQAADQLVQRCSERMLKHLKAWPKDSNSHNNLAWMLARCNTRIPEAIEHATKAVELSDRSPTYVDTLAEAEFCAGHIERAIELARECTESDPRHAHYQKQLQRFRSRRP